MLKSIFTRTKIVKDRNGLQPDKEVEVLSIGRIVGAVLTVVFVLPMVISMFNTVNMGYTAVYQNKFTKTTDVVHGPDFIFKPPFVATITEYKDDTTLSFAADTEDFSSMNDPIAIGFADTYKAKLPLNARMVLPLDDENMLRLHKSFRSQDNLVRSLYTKTMVDVAVNVATQFTAEEVFQGGLNSLKGAIEDQAAHGVFVTERKKVISEMGVTDRTEIGGKKTDSSIKTKAVYVWKAIPKRNKDGHAIRTSNPLAKYGIEVTQVNLAEPIPEQTLEKLLLTKKQLVAKKISSIQRQENAKAEIETAKLEGESKRVAAEQQRLIKADAEVIELKKQVQVAKQQALKEIVEQTKDADLAKIDKAKELQIAKDNQGIQKANAVAAKYQASAIEYKGLAQAKVKKAMYNAVRKDILELEVSRANVSAFSTNMKDFKVQMPTYMVNGSGEAGNGVSNSLETVMNAIGIKNLQELNAKTK